MSGVWDLPENDIRTLARMTWSTLPCCPKLKYCLARSKNDLAALNAHEMEGARLYGKKSETRATG